MDNFHVPGLEKPLQVPMMYQDDKFRYGLYAEDSVQVLEMFYKGEDISMVLVLPLEDTPLQTVEQNLSLQKLNMWINHLKEQHLNVHIPRCRIEDSFSLKENLEKLGLKDLFNPHNARLTG